MKQTILDPLREAVEGEFPDWLLPTFLPVDGVDVPLDSLHEGFEVDWKVVARCKTAVLESLQVEQWQVVFYLEEPDPTSPKGPDRLRLDALIAFTQGRWVRWHPSGDLMWSTEDLPTAAMVIRINRKKKLMHMLAKKERC